MSSTSSASSGWYVDGENAEATTGSAVRTRPRPLAVNASQHQRPVAAANIAEIRHATEALWTTEAAQRYTFQWPSPGAVVRPPGSPLVGSPDLTTALVNTDVNFQWGGEDLELPFYVSPQATHLRAMVQFSVSDNSTPFAVGIAIDTLINAITTPNTKSGVTRPFPNSLPPRGLWNQSIATYHLSSPGNVYINDVRTPLGADRRCVVRVFGRFEPEALWTTLAITREARLFSLALREEILAPSPEQ